MAFNFLQLRFSLRSKKVVGFEVTLKLSILSYTGEPEEDAEIGAGQVWLRRRPVPAEGVPQPSAPGGPPHPGETGKGHEPQVRGHLRQGRAKD